MREKNDRYKTRGEKIFQLRRKLWEENYELDKIIGEKIFQPKERQKKKTGREDGQQIPARENKLAVMIR